MKLQLTTVYIPVNGETDLAACYFSTFEEWTSKEGIKKEERIIFTPEEYNQHIQDVIKDALENAAQKSDITYTEEKTFDFTEVDKESITNTFNETFKKWKL